MAKKIKKIHTGSNMEGSNLGGNKANIKRVKQRHPNAPEYPPTHGGLLGTQRIDWGKKGNTPTGKGGSGSHNQVNRKTRIIEDMLKEGEGEGGDTTGLGATVFTSTNAGIFNPTYGGNGKKHRVRSKKKRTGIERLGVFLTDGSPEKKMKKDISKQLQEWLITSAQMEALRKEEPPKVVEREGHPDKLAAVKQKDIEQKISTLEDASKRSSEQTESHGNVSPHIADVTLSKQPQAFGNPQDDELKRSSKKDRAKWTESVELELQKFLAELSNKNNQTILDEINIRKSNTIESLLKRL